MGRDNRRMGAESQRVGSDASNAYNTTLTPSATEQEFLPFSQEMRNRFTSAADRGEQDYGRLMDEYTKFREGGGPGRVNVDATSMRARGVSPIRASYGNTMRELDRAKSLGGGGANYIAARSRAQRELPGQLSDAMTNVEASIADRQLQADMANQAAEQNWRGQSLGAINAMQGLYGSAPGAASMYGNQAMQGYGMRSGMEGQRQNYGLGLLGRRLDALNTEHNVRRNPYLENLIGMGGGVLGMFGGGGGES